MSQYHQYRYRVFLANYSDREPVFKTNDLEEAIMWLVYMYRGEQSHWCVDWTVTTVNNKRLAEVIAARV